MTLIVRTLRPIKSCSGKQVRSCEALRPTWEHAASALTSWRNPMQHGQSGPQLANLVAPASLATGPTRLLPEVASLASWAADSSWGLLGSHITGLLRKALQAFIISVGGVRKHPAATLQLSSWNVCRVAWTCCAGCRAARGVFEAARCYTHSLSSTELTQACLQRWKGTCQRMTSPSMCRVGHALPAPAPDARLRPAQTAGAGPGAGAPGMPPWPCSCRGRRMLLGGRAGRPPGRQPRI